MEAAEEEVEAAEAQAAAGEEAQGVSESAEGDSEAEAADLAPWGTDRTWAVVEPDQRLTAGYEKIRGMGRQKENPSTNRKCLGNVLLFASRLASYAPSQFASQANKMIAVTTECPANEISVVSC